VTGYEQNGRGYITGREKIFLLATASRATLGPTQPSIQCVQVAIPPEAKLPGREADHSPPTSAEVSTPPYVFMVWRLVN
jgi:hypothetical protein